MASSTGWGDSIWNTLRDVPILKSLDDYMDDVRSQKEDNWLANIVEYTGLADAGNVAKQVGKFATGQEDASASELIQSGFMFTPFGKMAKATGFVAKAATGAPGKIFTGTGKVAEKGYEVAKKTLKPKKGKSGPGVLSKLKEKLTSDEPTRSFRLGGKTGKIHPEFKLSEAEVALSKFSKKQQSEVAEKVAFNRKMRKKYEDVAKIDPKHGGMPAGAYTLTPDERKIWTAVENVRKQKLKKEAAEALIKTAKKEADDVALALEKATAAGAKKARRK